MTSFNDNFVRFNAKWGCGWTLVALAIAAAVVTGIEVLLAYLLAWAWNTLIAGMFHGPHMSFWQAVAGVLLLTLIRNLFTHSTDAGKR